jgi:hypothetical protein
MAKLKDLLEHRRVDLEWHHDVGKCVSDLSRRTHGVQEVSQGTRWLERLAKEVNYSAASLNKALRFADEYTPDEVERLRKQNVNWSKVLLSFPLKKEQRWKLFEQTRSQTTTELWQKVQKRGPHHPGTGRPPRKPRPVDYKLGLKQVIRAGNQWMRFTEASGRKVAARCWPSLRS